MTLLTVACQALLSMEFSRQEYWSGWPFPSPGLIALSTVNLQSQGWFVPVSLRPFLRIAAASMSWLQSGHHVVSFFHLMGGFSIYDSSQDMAQSIIYKYQDCS